MQTLIPAYAIAQLITPFKLPVLNSICLLKHPLEAKLYVQEALSCSRTLVVCAPAYVFCQTITPLTNQIYDGFDTAYLMTDGTVIARIASTPATSGSSHPTSMAATSTAHGVAPPAWLRSLRFLRCCPCRWPPSRCWRRVLRSL